MLKGFLRSTKATLKEEDAIIFIIDKGLIDMSKMKENTTASMYASTSWMTLYHLKSYVPITSNDIQTSKAREYCCANIRYVSKEILVDRIVNDICYIVLEIGLARTTAQAKNIAIGLAITLVRPS